MTLSDMRDRAARRFFDPDRIRITNDDWDFYLNDAYKSFVSELPWPFTESIITVSTVSGTDEVSLGTNTFNVLSVLNTDTDKKLYPVENREQFLRRWNDRDDSGEPINYLLHANTLKLFPTPDDAYSLEIYAHVEPGDLSADVDVPDLPARYHRALVDFALANATIDQSENMERVNFYMDSYRKSVVQAIKELGGARTERFAPVTDVFHYSEVYR